MSDGEKKRTADLGTFARVFPDHPLKKERLEFEFEGFARTLAELAWKPDNRTPFTVVVRGGWGRGKTTLLRRVQWMLEHPQEVKWPSPEGEEDALGLPRGVRDVRTLWFNAWKYPDDDTVLAGLLGAAIDRLRTGDKLEQLKNLAASYKGSALQTLLALAAPAQFRKLVEEGLEDRFQVVHERRAFHDAFRRLFIQVSRLMFDLSPAIRDTDGLGEEQLWDEKTQRRKVLVVFLDDLDRCRRDRVVEVIEAINLFLDLPGVIFFLGIDWERLVAALPDTVRGQGDQFLEKVVQVAFDLPEVSPTGAEGYVAGLLKGTDLATVLGGDGKGTDEDFRVVARALDTRHPRHVKRFLNDLSMSLAVLRNTGKLGEGEGRLPERAVVAWHLLPEVLTADRWREVRALPQFLVDFLRDAERFEKNADEPGEAVEEGEGHEEWRRIHSSGLAERHLKALRDLSEGQRHLLVYFATPPAMEVDRRRRRLERLHLLDLDSSAWVDIRGGTFWMGAQKTDPNASGHDDQAADKESPVHRVKISPFRIARHPVTNADYAAYVEATGEQPPKHWKDGRVPEGKERHPVVYVSWKDAMAFCQWFTQRVRQEEEDRIVRLPTEAEWEFAARGEKARRYPWDQKSEPTKELANFGNNVGDTTTVGSYPEGATPEDVEDLAGNVLEWCLDGPRSYRGVDETDPRGLEGATRVLRGGTFDAHPAYLRAAYRNDASPEHRKDNVGFRLLLGVSGGLES